MPEGDTVHRTARRLDAGLRGVPLLRADLRWPRLPAVDFAGVSTLEVTALGKHLLHRFDNGYTLHSHLRMEGQWRLERPGDGGEKWLRRPDIRAGLITKDWLALGLRLGMLDLLPTGDEATLVGHLGPDILAGDVDPVALATRVRAADRSIAEALLDQRNLAGIGTFWASEALFLARINPWTPAAEVDQAALTDLLTGLVRMMRTALSTGIQSSTGSTRRGATGYVHGRLRQQCRRCGSPIRVDDLGAHPRMRVMFWCPQCQSVSPTGAALEPGPTPRTPRR